MKNRRLWGWATLAVGVGCLVLTGFDAMAVNYSTPALLPVVGCVLVMLGAYLLLFSRRLQE